MWVFPIQIFMKILATRDDVIMFDYFIKLLINVLIITHIEVSWADNQSKQERVIASDLIEKATKFSCVENNFRGFINIFLDDIETQKKFTHYPLKKQTLIDTGIEPKELIKTYTKKQLKFPLISSLYNQKNLEMEMEPKSVNEILLRIFKPDTDIVIDYFFKKDKCWVLYKIEDWTY